MGYSMNLLIIAVEEAVFLKMCCGQTLLDELHKQIWLQVQQPGTTFEYYSKKKGFH